GGPAGRRHVRALHQPQDLQRAGDRRPQLQRAVRSRRWHRRDPGPQGLDGRAGPACPARADGQVQQEVGLILEEEALRKEEEEGEVTRRELAGAEADSYWARCRAARAARSLSTSR